MTGENRRVRTLGFLGTGTITSAIVTGLCTEPDAGEKICVSPRNAETAARLAATFPQVRVAASNQEVIEASDVVFLAVRPQVAADILAPLRFSPTQHVISLIATFSWDRVASLVRPAETVTCAVPQPTVAARLSPTAIFPSDRLAAALFNRLGTAFETSTESEFRALFATTAAMASFFSLLDSLASWLVSRGVPAAMAHDYVAKMFEGLSEVPARSALSFAELASEFKTQGGLNAQFASELDRGGVFGALGAGLDSILERIERGRNPA